MLTLVVITSCKSYKKIPYAQEAGIAVDPGQHVQQKYPDEVIKNGDFLMITVSTVIPEAAIPFNPPLAPDVSTMSGANMGRMSSGGSTLQPYLVDVNGEINFPVLGQLKVAGMTRGDLKKMLANLIYPKYTTDLPMVNVRFLDYSVSILGEVGRPGLVTSNKERLSIFEAIASAGDLTIYGRRDNVLLIREENAGERKTYRIDLTNKDLINSSYYFLQKNDVLYVQPNKVKSRSTSIGSAETLTLSVVGILISFTSLIATLTR